MGLGSCIPKQALGAFAELGAETRVTSLLSALGQVGASRCLLTAATVSCHQQTSWWEGQGGTWQSLCSVSLFCPWGREPHTVKMMGSSTPPPDEQEETLGS